MNPRAAIPRSWTDRLGSGPLGLGLDLATTDKGTSNPSALTVLEGEHGRFYTRLAVSWKTADPEVTEAILALILADLQDLRAIIRRLSIDASNEVFFATNLKTKFNSVVPVSLIKGGEKLEHKGESMLAKNLLGSLYVNALDDNILTLPSGQFLTDDHRLVQRERGTFVAATSRTGQHGDLFDSGKLALWSLIKGGGRVRADAVDISGGGSAPLRPGLFGPIKRLARKIRLNN